MKLKKIISYKQNSKPRVIINADDFGISKGVNKAIFELADAGIVTSTSVMSNMPDYRYIMRLNGKIGIGIHFNLTTGKPATEPIKIPTLVNKQEEFFPLSELLKRTRLGKVSMKDVEVELGAQIERLRDCGIQPDHINSHESILKYPFFSRIMRILAKDYKIMAVRTYVQRKFSYNRLLSPRKTMISIYLGLQKLSWKIDGFRVADRYDSLLEAGIDFQTAIAKLRDIFQNLPHGVLEVGVHPGYCNGTNILLGEYINEREVELRALLSEEFRGIVRDSNIKLINFKDI